MNSVFDASYHLRCAYSQIIIIKIGDKKISVFTADSNFRSISRVMGEKMFSVFIAGSNCCRRGGLVIERRTPEREVGSSISIKLPCFVFEQDIFTSQKVLITR